MYCCYLSSVAKIGVEARERPSAAEVGLTIVFTLVHELRSFLCKGTEKFVLQVDIHRLWHRIYLFRIPAFAGLSRPLVRGQRRWTLPFSKRCDLAAMVRNG